MTNENPAGQKISAGHILVVEDDAFMSGLLNRKLTQENFQISAVTNTAEAKSVLEKENIGLILLDVVLPGADGIFFLKEIKQRANFNNIPVIITSNLGQEEEVERGLKEGAVDYLVKANTTPSEIANKVKETLTKK